MEIPNFGPPLPTPEAAPPSFFPQLPPLPPIPPDFASAAAPAPEEPNVFYPQLDKAAKQLADAEILSPDEYYAIRADARQDAFTIAGDIVDDAKAKIRDTLAKQIREGGDEASFTKEVAESFDSGLPLSKPHLEQVFRNNAFASLSDGQDRAVNNPLVVDAFPYRAYFATSDARVRPEHKALETMGLDGTNIYRADDPVWRLFRPPWSWNCRCSWATITVRQAANRGVSEAKEWLGRAEKLAADEQTSVARVLARAAPVIPQHVAMPAFASDSDVLDPRWARPLD